MRVDDPFRGLPPDLIVDQVPYNVLESETV